MCSRAFTCLDILLNYKWCALTKVVSLEGSFEAIGWHWKGQNNAWAFCRSKPDCMLIFQAHVYQERRVKGKAFELYDVLVFCARASFNVWARRKSPRAQCLCSTNEPTTSSKRLWRCKLTRYFFDPFTLIEEAQQDLWVKTTLIQDPSQPKRLLSSKKSAYYWMSLLFLLI